MKKHGLIGLIVFTLLTLAGCSTTHSSYQTSDALRESWMPKVSTNPNVWLQHADSWFITGNPNELQQQSSHAPSSDAMTMMTVKVPQFNKIDTGGNFQVQIVGGQKQNSVYILGSNDAARLISVSVAGDTLYVHEAMQKNTKNQPIISTHNVIVRIGVSNLRKLTYGGNGNVSARFVTSDGLSINSCGNGRVLIDGQRAMLLNVTQTGNGTVTVLNVQSPHVDVTDLSAGDININGRVGVSHIVNCGSGRITIIGADSNGLTVDTSGTSFTSVFGYVNLCRLTAQQDSSVYIYWVNSPNLILNETGHGCVGLAGEAGSFNVNMRQAAQLAGQYLKADTVYIHTYDNAHAIVTVCNTLFAAAEGGSSIYYYGLPANVSRITKQQGVVLHVQPIIPIPVR